MASTYSDLKFELIGTGEQSGVWGTTTNDNIGTAIEQALVGLGNPIFTTDANLTISLTNTVALQTARALVLNATSSGSLTATRELVVPTIEKQYIVQNNTTGGQSITVKTTAGTGITITNGRKAHLYVDGVNVIQMFDFVDINGGAVDGTPIGATTASTGAFTTLAASGAVTLSGGTANGVTYLNGSKVLTSGSALTFDGTKFTQTASTTGVLAEFKNSATNAQNGNINATNDAGTALRMQVFGSAAGSYGMLSAGSPVLYTSASDLNFVADNASGVIKFGLNAASEQMRLTSTGLGIGTSSPSAKLHVKGGNTNNLKIDNGGEQYTEVDWLNNGTIKAAAYWDNTNAQFYVGAQAANSSIVFGTSGGVKATIDSSGNLGLGVTPSAWYAGPRAFQISSYVSLSQQANGNVNLAFNTNEATSNTFTYRITGDVAGMFRISGNAFSWLNAASGTAGNAITFTQAMTLDASGNLGVGATSITSSRVQIKGANNTTTAFADGLKVTSNNESVICNYSWAGIDASANLKLATAGSERARIDSSGNLLVGTTTVLNGSVATFYKTATATNQRVASFTNDATPGVLSPAGLSISYPNAAGGNGSTFLECADGTTVRLNILGSGNVQNANNSYGAISDVKRKENIVDATPKLEKLNQVRIVNFNMIGDTQKQIGVIAQELEQVFPGMVEETSDTDKDGNDLGTTTKSVKYSVFVPMLIKAMQEQQAIITALTARVASLESN